MSCVFASFKRAILHLIAFRREEKPGLYQHAQKVHVECKPRTCVACTGQGYLWQVHRDPLASVAWPLAAWSKQLWETWLDGSAQACSLPHTHYLC